MSTQLLRCGTSIGANVRESKADFVNKMNIALKEADESQYWLELLHESSFLTDNEFESLNDDLGKILGTLTKIIKSSKSNG